MSQEASQVKNALFVDLGFIMSFVFEGMRPKLDRLHPSVNISSFNYWDSCSL